MSVAAKSMAKSIAWWEDQELKPNSIAKWVVGSSTLWLKRLPNEWQVVHEQIDDPMHDAVGLEVPVSDPDSAGHPFTVPPSEKTLRYATSCESARMTLHPVHADRAIVVRPEAPFFVLPHEEISFYVSMPVWLQLRLGDKNTVAFETPSFRLRDTWLGASTGEGELCYATQTTGRLELAQLPLRPHRAITQVVVRNVSNVILALERIKMPVQHLSLYVGPRNYLWTQTATLEGDASEQVVTAHIRPEPPAMAQGARLLSEPRILEPGTLVRRFTSLFSTKLAS